MCLLTVKLEFIFLLISLCLETTTEMTYDYSKLLEPNASLISEKVNNGNTYLIFI